jgi:uncharacterized membrane protein YdjX (TVP38/TMEM64 family)
MKKNRGIFKQFQALSKINPSVALALLWVSLAPSAGSFVIIPFLISHYDFLQQLDLREPMTVLAFLGCSTLLMGLALMPTTLIAGLAGFLFGWKVFIWLILGYTLAAMLGYIWGSALTGNSLELLLEQYPVLKNKLSKSNRKGELVFFVRISPVIPFALSNLVFAMLKIGWYRLILFGSLGMLPRTTLVFFSGTLASDLTTALGQEGFGWNSLWILALLIASVWGIWRFFSKPVAS